MDTAARIAVALLMPFWWGFSLLLLALLGDGLPGGRAVVSRLFDWLEDPEQQMETTWS